MFSKKLSRYVVLFLSLALTLPACGGGGSSSGGGGNHGSALVVASKVSVVSAQTSSNVASGKPSVMGRMKSLLFSAPTLTSLSATSDYVMDKTNVYVEERTSDAFKTINQILCMIGQTKYDVMLNKGVYTALVDKNLCDTSNADPSSAGQQAQNQSSGANMPSYMRFTVEATRADDSSPEYISVWVHQPASSNDHAALIYGKGIISEGTSTNNPYGIFTFNFAGYNYNNLGQLPPSPSFKGTLEAVRSIPTDTTSKVLLKFVSNDSHFDGYCGTATSSQAVTLDRQPDGSAGAGLVSVLQTCPSHTQYSSTESFQIAYNSADFYRNDLITAGTPSCFSRTQVNESAWSYGLYDSAGARVARNSGFPITFTKSGTQYQGWIGYWGLWTDNNAPALADGDTVTQVDYRNNTSKDYKVFMAGGKLKKHDRKYLTLNEIRGIPLSYWEQLESCGTGTQYQVVYDGTHFNKVAQMACGNNNCTWATIGSTPIDLNNFPQGSLNFWSDSLGGQAQIQLVSSGTGTCAPNTDNSCTTCTKNYTLPAGSTLNTVIFYAETVVNPGDTVPAQLACYDNCPLSSALSTTNPFYLWTFPTTTHAYTFDSNVNDANAMVLMDAGNQVVTSATDTNFQWGIQSGALIDPTTPSLATLLDCNYDNDNNPATQPAICGWKAWNNFQTFYTWETGPNNWNQFVTLKDTGGSFIPPFQAPLNVQYVNNGTTYILQYAGFGQLQGIPGKCIDMETGLDADCSAGGAIRWVPQFTIPALDPSLNDGTLNTVTDQADNTPYFVKPLDIEQRMAKESDPAVCTTLGGTDFSTYTLPDISIFSNPASAEPSAPVAPAVIGGVVQ